MKLIPVFLILLGVTLTAAEKAPVDSVTLSNGRALSDVELVDVNEKGAKVKHQRGTQTLRFAELDLDDVKSLTGLDPETKPAHRSIAALLSFDPAARAGESKADHRSRVRVHLENLDQQIDYHWSKVNGLSDAAKKGGGAATAMDDHKAMAFALEVARASLKDQAK